MVKQTPILNYFGGEDRIIKAAPRRHSGAGAGDCNELSSCR